MNDHFTEIELSPIDLEIKTIDLGNGDMQVSWDNWSGSPIQSATLYGVTVPPKGSAEDRPVCYTFVADERVVEPGFFFEALIAMRAGYDFIPTMMRGQFMGGGKFRCKIEKAQSLNFTVKQAAAAIFGLARGALGFVLPPRAKGLVGKRQPQSRQTL